MDSDRCQQQHFNVGQWNAAQREAERETERKAALKQMDDYKPPQMEFVTLRELRVDEKYQRALSMTKVHMLRAYFSPNACQPLAVSHRENGVRYIVDGQHRSQVLQDIGISEWLGLVYRGLTPKDEAAMWEEVNTRQTKPQPIFRFRALLIKRDPETVNIVGVVTGAGLKVNFERLSKGKNAGKRILAVTALQKIYRQYKAPALADVLKLLQQAWTDDDDSQRAASPLLLGLAGFLGGTYRTPIDFKRAATAIGHMSPEKWLAKVRGSGASATDVLVKAFREKYNNEAAGRTGKL
jgi:hypothetical protein